ncbi:hypothetical protein Esti_003984 [Eimeria stiedai]
MTSPTKMEKRYILALTSEPVDLGSPRHTENQSSSGASAEVPSICQSVLPRVATRFASVFPQFEFICCSSEADLERQKSLVEKAEVIFMLDAPSDLFGFSLPLVPGLRWIHSYMAGVDGLCRQLRCYPEFVEARNLLLTNGKGVFSSSLKEYAIAVILHFAKHIPRLQTNKANKKWERFLMGEIRGRTVGFVGYGDIAKEIASACKFFGMRCIALRRSGSKKEELLEAVYLAGEEEQLEVYRQADFVVCSLPATPETQNCISTRQFAAMKRNGVFISIGRGCVVDETALVHALKSGQIAGAALDVFQTEPLPVNSPLWEAPNLLVSSHNADWCEEHSAEASTQVFEQNMRKLLAGVKSNQDMATPVDCMRGY